MWPLCTNIMFLLPVPLQNLIYLAGSASAEFFADIALCPFEAVKVGAGHAVYDLATRWQSWDLLLPWAWGTIFL